MFNLFAIDNSGGLKLYSPHLFVSYKGENDTKKYAEIITCGADGSKNLATILPNGYYTLERVCIGDISECRDDDSTVVASAFFQDMEKELEFSMNWSCAFFKMKLFASLLSPKDDASYKISLSLGKKGHEERVQVLDMKDNRKKVKMVVSHLDTLEVRIELLQPEQVASSSDAVAPTVGVVFKFLNCAPKTTENIVTIKAERTDGMVLKKRL